MKIVVLGGAGDMAQRAVKDLVRQEDVSKLTIADINREKAAALAGELNNSKVEVIPLDAENHADMVDKIKDYDVACGGVGPFYRFEKKVVSACIEAGVDYVSICDDHDAVKSVLPLDDMAKERKVRVITGMGWTPGLTNMLAREGYEALQEVKEINVYWGGSANDSQGFAVILHTLHIFDGRVPVFSEGREIEVEAGSEAEAVDFGGSLGRMLTFNVGHPEPVTIPRYLSQLETVTLKGGLKENYLNRFTRFLAKMRLINTPRKKHVLGKIVVAFLPLLHRLDKSVSYSGTRVEVTGYKDDRKVKLVFRAVDHMNNLTGLPLSIGALMLGRGEIDRKGVFAPEADGGVAPALFREYLDARGVQVNRDEEPL